MLSFFISQTFSRCAPKKSLQGKEKIQYYNRFYIFFYLGNFIDFDLYFFDFNWNFIFLLIFSFITGISSKQFDETAISLKIIISVNLVPTSWMFRKRYSWKNWIRVLLNLNTPAIQCNSSGDVCKHRVSEKYVYTANSK